MTVHRRDNTSSRISPAQLTNILTNKTDGEFGFPLTDLRLCIDCCGQIRFQVHGALFSREHFTMVIGLSLELLIDSSRALSASILQVVIPLVATLHHFGT